MAERAEVQGDTAGVVLAGGASRRMGRDKAGLEIGGEPLVCRVVRRLGCAVPRVVVVGPPTLQALLPGVTVIPDRVSGLGPLAGLAAAFAAVGARWLFVVACDMPFVAPSLVRAMLEVALASSDAQVVALRTARGLEPLHAAYARSCAPAIEAQLASRDHSLTRLLSGLTVREVPEPVAAIYDPAGRSAFNANTSDEWQWALRLAVAEEQGGGGAASASPC